MPGQVCHLVALGWDDRSREERERTTLTACGETFHTFAIRAQGYVTSWLSDTTCPACRARASERTQRARSYQPNGRKP